MPQDQVNAQDVERQVFEGAMASHGYEINPERYADGSYRAPYYQAGWLMWQASAGMTSYLRRAACSPLDGAIGARVDGSNVVLAARGGNNGARELCAKLVSMLDPKKPCGECHLQSGERCNVCGASSGT